MAGSSGRTARPSEAGLWDALRDGEDRAEMRVRLQTRSDERRTNDVFIVSTAGIL